MQSITNDYLALLGLKLEAPTNDYLEKICHAHLNTFPFENISKLIYYRDREKNKFEIPAYSLFAEQYTKYHFGGTCYSLNSNLYTLLKELGFKCYLIMLGKVHMGIVVEIETERVYVDCGAAAPIFKPIRFEHNSENKAQFGEDQVFLKLVNPDQDEFEYVRYLGGVQSGNSWTFHSKKKFQLSDFYQVITDSNQPGADFMTLLRCQLWQTEQGRSVSLVNNGLTIRKFDGSTEKYNLNSVAVIKEVIQEEFRLPRLPVEEAIEVLKELNIDIFAKNDSQ
ncbi:arylamine N-acetyltransferase [Pseudoneobacillus sp. C159]